MYTILHTSSGSIGITWDDGTINEIILKLFSPWQCNGSLPVYQVEIRERGSEYLLITPHNTILFNNVSDLFINLEFTLTELFEDIFKKDLLIHASCIDKKGSGALFIGPHGIGKTTLALTAISSGLKALTDDVTIMQNNSDKVVIGFPRPFKVSADIWNMEPPVVPQDCFFFECSNELRYVYFYQPAKYYSESTHLKHLIFPTRGNKTTEIREMGETEALQRLLIQGFNFYQRKETIVGELIELLRTAPPLELLYNNNWDAITKVKELL
jgi:hypothetical protein